MLNPGTHIVFLILFWFTDGFIEPGVHFVSGKLPFTIWHSVGVVKLVTGDSEIDANDDNAVVALEMVFDLLPRFWWICWTWVDSFWVLILFEGFWNNPPNILSKGPGNDNASVFWKCWNIILDMVDRIKSPAKKIIFKLRFTDLM